MTFVATDVLSLVYGYNINSPDDPVVKLIQGFNNVATEATPERAALLHLLPFIKYMLSWIPGLGFLKCAPFSRQLVLKVRDQPFEYMKYEVLRLKDIFAINLLQLNPFKAAGTAAQSMVADFLSNQQEDKDSESYEELEVAMKNAASSVYLAGSETNFHSRHDPLSGGEGRLPTLDDLDSLPYIEAVIIETMRWHPPAPLGIPHATTMNDEVQVTIYQKEQSSFSIHGDVTRLCRSHQFKPERHLLSTGELSQTARMISNPSFVFGRRICPGRFSADNALWAAFAQILGAVRFSKAKDADGQPIEIDPSSLLSTITTPFFNHRDREHT